MHRRHAILALIVTLSGCHRPPTTREYRLVGQILDIDRRSVQVTVRHEDIVGFMPAMTMPYKVKDSRLLDGRTPGELIEATLEVAGAVVQITQMRVTGTAPIPPREAVPTSLAPGDMLPDAPFVDQNGVTFRLRSLHGRPLVLAFIYTRCPLPDFCPAIESKLSVLQRHIKTDGRVTGAALVTVTIDPEYDTPAVLREHAAARGADPAIWRFVTGSVADVDAFGRQFGLSVTRGNGGALEIQHNLRTVVVNREGRIVHIQNGADWRVDDLLTPLLRAAGRS
jgi:protein SCO1/2